MAILDVAKEHVEALRVRDWRRFGETLAEDVHREGPEGPETDAIDGKAAYLEWCAALMDPLFVFNWTPLRIQDTADGKSVWIEAQSEYEPKQGDERFGYRLAVLLDFNDQGLVKKASYFWKTPRKRLAWDTISRTKN